MTEPDPLAVAAMVAYCGWDPTMVVDETVLLDGNGTLLLTLPSLYVTAVTAVTVTDQWGSTTARTVAPTVMPAPGLVPQADVGWSVNGVLIWNGCDYPVWPQGQRNVAVTYAGGYSYPPDDLVAAVASIGRRTAGPMGVTSRKMGTGSVGFSAVAAAGGLLLIEEMVLDRYRLPKVSSQ